MPQILYTQQIRSDRLLDVFGILVVFTLASSAAVFASKENTQVARIVLLGIASIFFALGIRGIWFYFQRVSFSLVISTETIIWGWVHKPKSQKTVSIADIKRIDFLEKKDDGRVLLDLDSGKKVYLPMHLLPGPESDLRKVFEKHFPHIEIA